MASTSDLRKRTPASAARETTAESETVAGPSVTRPLNEQRARHDHGHDHDHDHEHDHDHDHPIDDEKLDNLLWEIAKFCIPVGFILYLFIYLCYRHELLSWFSRTRATPASGYGRVIGRDIGPGARPQPDSIRGKYQEGAADPVPAQGAVPSDSADVFERYVDREREVPEWARSAVNAER